MTFRKKWENYWYHYKYATFAAIFVIVFLFIGVSSIVNKKTNDLHIFYYSTQPLASNASENFRKSLADDGVIRDIDGDGEKNFYMDAMVSTFTSDEQVDVAAQQKLQVVMMAGEHTLVLAHQYALEDYASYFEDISHKVRDGDKTFTDSNENYISGISVEGNEYLEKLGINTEGLYVAMRRRTESDVEKGENEEYFKLGYEVMDHILSYN